VLKRREKNNIDSFFSGYGKPPYSRNNLIFIFKVQYALQRIICYLILWDVVTGCTCIGLKMQYCLKYIIYRKMIKSDTGINTQLYKFVLKHKLFSIANDLLLFLFNSVFLLYCTNV